MLRGLDCCAGRAGKKSSSLLLFLLLRADAIDERRSKDVGVKSGVGRPTRLVPTPLDEDDDMYPMLLRREGLLSSTEGNWDMLSEVLILR